MPRGNHRPPLRIAFSCCGLSRLGCFVFVLADEIIYWVKIAGQKQKHSDFFVCRWLLASFLSGFIYFGCRFWSSIMLAPCWCYRSGSVDSMFTQWGRCCDMTARQLDPLPPCAFCVCEGTCVSVCVWLKCILAAILSSPSTLSFNSNVAGLRCWFWEYRNLSYKYGNKIKSQQMNGKCGESHKRSKLLILI